MGDSIIEVKNVTKIFKVPHERRNTLKEYFVNIFHPRDYEKMEVLKDISFTIKKGEFLGIIGRNGSGKSTLLKIIAGILQPNNGEVVVNGTIAPFLELGVGFQPDLSARDNVYLYGAILGLSRETINRKFDEIIAFAGLEKFVDQKLKNFSSGMQVRLAFATAIHAEADILLVDEVLAVGDADFQRKCLHTFRRLKREGRTIVFVSHDLSVVEKFCTNAIFIKKGGVAVQGAPEEVIKQYVRSFVKIDSGTVHETRKRDIGITSVLFKNSNNQTQATFRTGEQIKVIIECTSKNEVQDIIFGLEFFNDQGVYLSGINMKMDNIAVKRISGTKTVEFIIENNPFLDGVYYVTPAVANHEGSLIYDRLDKMFTFEVKNPEGARYYGPVKVPFKWNY